MNILIKRIYEPFSKTDGYRVLIDRLWPRGMKKEDAHIDKWMKEIAPSTELRKWFNHEPEKWEEFRAKYQYELKGSPFVDELLNDIREHETVTLLFSVKNELYNHAIVLKRVLTERLS